MDRLAFYCAAFLLTVISPSWSLWLFVIVSPWDILATDIAGWDPRLLWSVFLALRAGFVFTNPATGAALRLATYSVLTFAAVAYVRLLSSGGLLSDGELEQAKVTLFYFVAGSCAAYAIIKTSHPRVKTGRLLLAAAASLLLASGFGLYQAGSSTMATRVTGPTGNPNVYAAHVTVAATMMLSYACLDIGWRRGLYCASAITAFAACIFTFSRMGLLASILGIGLTIWTASRRSINWKWIAVSMVSLSLIAGLMRGYLAMVRNTLPYDGQSAEVDFAKVSQEAEDLSRFEAVQFAFGEFLEHPVLGVGFSTLAARNYSATGLYVTTHNTYAQILAGCGLVGAGLIALLVMSLVRSIPPHRRRFGIPVLAVFAFCSFFIDFLQIIGVLVTLAIVVAILRSEDDLTPLLPHRELSHAATGSARS